jgi:hypothetical protein
MSTFRGPAAALLLAVACAPQPVDRVTVDGAVTATGGAAGRGGAGGAGGSIDGTGDAAIAAGGSGGSFDATGGTGGRMDAMADRRPPDLSPDRQPDLPPPPDVLPPDAALPDLPPMPDTAPDTPLPQVVQLVVGDTGTLGAGDATIRTVLATRLPGFTIRLRDDGGALDLTNTRLYVIAGSVESGTVANRYRDVAVPVICLEYSLFDNMGLTGPTENTDYGVVGGTQVNILEPLHPLAAGLSGMIAIVSASSNIGWGAPLEGAVRVAALANMPARAAVFAFEPGTQLRGLVAPAKRVGLFVLESAAANLNENGIRLLGAAVDWALAPP